jgi:hypothetical protein
VTTTKAQASFRADGIARFTAGEPELMPQNQNFGFQPPSRLEAVAQHADKKEANCNHPAIMF